MQRTLRETNQEDVDLEERLSDEVYEYDGLQLKLAGDNNLERDAEAMEPMPHRHSKIMEVHKMVMQRKLNLLEHYKKFVR